MIQNDIKFTLAEGQNGDVMKKSRILIGIAAVLLVVLALGTRTNTQAAESGGISWNYESGILTLTGEGEMTDVSSGGEAPWGQYASLVSEIQIGKGITSVGERSFYGFTALKTVVIADSVSEIGAHAFSGCTLLESVQYPAYLKAIGEGAFNGCSSLPSAVLPSSCRSIGAYAYASCTSLKHVHMPASLTELGAYAFFGAVSLESVQLPATLTAIPESCFRACASLSAITLPSLLGSVGDYAFFGCSALTSLPLPEEVREIGAYAFAESGLGAVRLPDKLTKIGAYAFSSCTELVNLTLPKTLKAIPDGLCLSCKKLERIEFPVTLESIGADAFSYCLALKEVTLPSNLRSIGAHAFAYGNSLEKLTFQSVNCFVAGSSASPVFRSCTALSEVVFGEEVSLIPTALCYGLTGLQRVSMGDSVREIGASAFEGCTALSEISLSASLGRVGESAFYRCQSLTSLYLPESITVAGRYAFYTDEGGRLFLASERTPSGFDTAWRGESTAYFAGEWVKCSFDAAGQTLSAQYLPIGESAQEPTVDSYEPRKGYTAYFSGWDLNGDGKADSIPLQVWSSFRATALFREIPNKYLCRFFDDDGRLIAEYSLYYDSEITLPASPEKASDGLYEYYFTSWNGYTEGMKVSGNHDFTASYRAVLLDLLPPFAVGIANGEVYYAAREVEIGDEGGLLSVTLDGVAQEVNLGKAHLVLPADGKSHRIAAVDEAGWELVIEVRGVNVSALIDAMPAAEAAALGAEEELLRVFAEIDTLLTKPVTENDKIALQTRRRELFSAYQRAAAAHAFAVVGDENVLFEEIGIKKAFLHLLGEEETNLMLNGSRVLFEIEISALASLAEDEGYRLLAESQGKAVQNGYSLKVYRCVTAPDGMKRREESTLFSEVNYSLPVTQEMQASGIGFLLTVGNRTEALTADAAGNFALTFTSPFSIVMLAHPPKDSGLGWQALVAVVVGVSLFTSLLLAFFARFLVRRRASASRALNEKEAENEDSTVCFFEERALLEEGKGDAEESDSASDELYGTSAPDLASEGFSLYEEDEEGGEVRPRDDGEEGHLTEDDSE